MLSTNRKQLVNLNPSIFFFWFVDFVWRQVSPISNKNEEVNAVIIIVFQFLCGHLPMCNLNSILHCQITPRNNWRWIEMFCRLREWESLVSSTDRSNCTNRFPCVLFTEFSVRMFTVHIHTASIRFDVTVHNVNV